MRLTKAALTALVITLVVPAAAQASRVELLPGNVQNCDKGGCVPATAHFLTYTGGSGEVNHVKAERGSGGWTIRDATAVLEAGQGCTSSDEHTAVCGQSSSPIKFELGDGDDDFDGRTLDTGVTVNGGAGNDLIRGGFGPDTIDAGDGSDQVAGAGGADQLKGGGGGTDTIRGGASSDTLSDEDGLAPGPDTFDGEEGVDRLDYSARVGGVTVDLSAPGRPQLGEGDTVTSIEEVIGGEGPDLLIGTPARDVFEGRGGDDRIASAGGDDAVDGGGGGDRLQSGEGNDGVSGGDGADFISASAGNDRLAGGNGRDTLIGGPGDDRLDTADGAADTITCGRGADRLRSVVAVNDPYDRFGPGFREETSGPDAADLLSRDCEQAWLVSIRPRRAAASFVDFTNPCVRCRGTVRLRAGGRTLALHRFRTGRAGDLRVPVRGLRRGTAVSVRWDTSRGDAAYRMILRP